MTHVDTVAGPREADRPWLGCSPRVRQEEDPSVGCGQPSPTAVDSTGVRFLLPFPVSTINAAPLRMWRHREFRNKQTQPLPLGNPLYSGEGTTNQANIYDAKWRFSRRISAVGWQEIERYRALVIECGGQSASFGDGHCRTMCWFCGCKSCT